MNTCRAAIQAACSTFPTPIARSLASLLDADSNNVAERAVDVFTDWLDTVSAIALAVYLQRANPAASLNALIFASANEESSTTGRRMFPSLNFLLTMASQDGLGEHQIVSEFQHALLRTVAASDGRPSTLHQLVEHRNFFAHGLSLGADQDELLRAVAALVSCWETFFSRWHIQGVADGSVWRFVGGEPVESSPDNLVEGLPGVWLQSDVERIELDAFCFVAEDRKLACHDAAELAGRIGASLQSRPQLQALYTRYLAEWRGQFAFAEPVDEPAPAAFAPAVTELIKMLADGRRCLVARHRGSESSASWIQHAARQARFDVLRYPAAFSPVCCFGLPFGRWLARELAQLTGAANDDLPRTKKALQRALQAQRSALRSQSRRVLLVIDDLHLLAPAANHTEDLSVLLDELPSPDLVVLGLAEPVACLGCVPFPAASLDARQSQQWRQWELWMNSFKRFYWGPSELGENVSACTREDAVALIDQYAPPGSRQRDLCELVAATGHALTIAELAETLEIGSPQTQILMRAVAPLLLHQRGVTDLEEGLRQAELFDPILADVLGGRGPEQTLAYVQKLERVRTDSRRLAERLQAMQTREYAPSHGPE